MLRLKTCSKAKSLSETASIEFLVTDVKPNFFASLFLSMLNLFPDKAPEPSGLIFNCSLPFSNLNKSLLIISYHDIK